MTAELRLGGPACPPGCAPSRRQTPCNPGPTIAPLKSWKNPIAMMLSRGQNNALLEAFVDAVATHVGIDPDTDLRPRVFVHAGFGAMLAAARNWLATGARGPLHDLTSEALDLVDVR